MRRPEGRPRVLVVDDDRAVRDSLRRSLEYSGYEVSTAEDGVQAMARLAAVRPDAVIMDVMMPRLDGLEVCRRLKSDPLTKDIVVVLLTAMAQDSDRERGFAAGADDYFTKPFSPLALLHKVEAVRLAV